MRKAITVVLPDDIAIEVSGCLDQKKNQLRALAAEGNTDRHDDRIRRLEVAGNVFDRALSTAKENGHAVPEAS